MERRQWNEHNLKVINRIRAKAFPSDILQLQHIHVLDLAAEGWIKPHVDSIKVNDFCILISCISKVLIFFLFSSSVEALLLV